LNSGDLLRRKKHDDVLRLFCLKIKRAWKLSPQMMIDIRPVTINGWVALRLLSTGFSMRIKDLPQLRPQPSRSIKLKVSWPKYC
jgi:hypothetical protein